jgi:hypothetical protein
MSSAPITPNAFGSSATARAVVPKMPCFESGFYGFHHTVDSALKILSELGISASRVTIQMDGRGLPDRWVVSQTPPPGTLLDGSVNIKLSVAGLGYFHALPVGMWDKGGDEEPGTKEVLELLDDPLQKAAHWVREGARLFDLQPENFLACSRWISLFGLTPEDWPPEIWYDLSLLLPTLQELAATEQGIRLIFKHLLHLPIKEVRSFPYFRSLPAEDCSSLADKSCRLGVDFVLGNRVEDLAGVLLVVGPVSLSSYYEYQQEEKKRLFSAVLDLSMSCRRKVRVSWLVADPNGAPRLGFEEENGRLGVNSHLGALAPVT